MRKRDLFRHFPGFSRVAKALDDLEHANAQLAAEVQQLRGAEAEAQQLKTFLHQMIFTSDDSLVEDGDPEMIEGSGGLPVPAGVLRFLVAGTGDLRWFLRSGQLGAQTIVDVLARQGQSLDQCKRVLDFGCGCGRVLRHLKDITGADVHGTDSNPRAIRWCEQHLDFAQFNVNALEPPLPYPDGMFDLIYAFSVFTHLTEPMQARWMDELGRILVPGGLLLLTVHGTKFVESLLPAERSEYDEGKLVVRASDVAGTNDCSAFHSESYVRAVLARSFDVVDFIPEGAKGNPPQDAYLMKSRPSGRARRRRSRKNPKKSSKHRIV